MPMKSVVMKFCLRGWSRSVILDDRPLDLIAERAHVALQLGLLAELIDADGPQTRFSAKARLGNSRLFRPLWGTCHANRANRAPNHRLHTGLGRRKRLALPPG